MVLGRKIARELFDEVEPVGRPVRVGGSRMRVIGVLAGRGVQMGVNLDDCVVVPVATGLRMANRASLTRLLLEIRGPAPTWTPSSSRSSTCWTIGTARRTSPSSPRRR